MMRQRAQSFVEFGLIMAAVAVVGMLGLQGVVAVQKVYFGDVAPSLAPSAAAVPGDVLHTVDLAMICSPAAVNVGQTTTCTVQVTDLHTGPTPPQGTVKPNISSGPPPSDCTTLVPATSASSTCQFTFTPTASQFGQLTFDLKYVPRSSSHLGTEKTFPITVIGLSTVSVTCKNDVDPSLGSAVEVGHPIG